MSDAPVLVTGATGFLGARVMLALRGRASAVGVARRPEAAPAVLAGEAWRAADLAERGAANGLLRALAPRAVIHAAALSNAAACESRPADARRVNTGAAVELAAAAQALGVRFVHVSTDLVFGETSAPRGGFREDDATGPVSVYGESKRDAEQRVLALGGDALVVRLPLLYGDSLGRGLGATDALHAALEQGETPTLFDDEWRTPLDVGDAAASLVELALGEDAPRGLLHLAGPERMTRLDLGLAALEARGVAPEDARAAVRAAPRDSLGLVPPRPADTSLDASRACALPGLSMRSAAVALRPA